MQKRGINGGNATPSATVIQLLINISYFFFATACINSYRTLWSEL